MKVLKCSFHNMMTVLIALMVHPLPNNRLYLMKKMDTQVNALGSTFENFQYFRIMSFYAMKTIFSVTLSLNDQNNGLKMSYFLLLLCFTVSATPFPFPLFYSILLLSLF